MGVPTLRLVWKEEGISGGNRARLIKILRGGGLVAYPTDTSYGLGADPGISSAVEKVYTAKGREKDQPLPLIISQPAVLDRWVAHRPASFVRLSKIFWPGPVTFVLEAREGIPAAILGGGGSIAVRLPASRPARFMAGLCAGAIIATSANRSGKPEPANAGAVCREIGEHLDAILDGGDLPPSRPSTVVDLTGPGLRMIREGAVAMEAIEKALSEEKKR